MERQLDFTLDVEFEGFPALITRMKADGMRVIIILVSCYVTGWSLFGRLNGLWWRKLHPCVFFHAMSREIEVQYRKCISLGSRKLYSMGGSHASSLEEFSFSLPWVILWLWFPHLTCALILGPSHFWQRDQALSAIHTGCRGRCLHQRPEWWEHCLGKGMPWAVIH